MIQKPQPTELQKTGQTIYTIGKERVFGKEWRIYYLRPHWHEWNTIAQDRESSWHYKKDAQAVADAQIPIKLPDDTVMFISEQEFFDEYHERQKRYKQYSAELQSAIFKAGKLEQTNHQRNNEVVWAVYRAGNWGRIWYSYPFDYEDYTATDMEYDSIHQYAQTNFRYMGNDPVELTPEQFQAELENRKRNRAEHIKKARF